MVYITKIQTSKSMGRQCKLWVEWLCGLITGMAEFPFRRFLPGTTPISNCLLPLLSVLNHHIIKINSAVLDTIEAYSGRFGGFNVLYSPDLVDPFNFITRSKFKISQTPIWDLETPFTSSPPFTNSSHIGDVPVIHFQSPPVLKGFLCWLLTGKMATCWQVSLFDGFLYSTTSLLPLTSLPLSVAGYLYHYCHQCHTD
jgi:hypothetical protein